MIEPLVERDGRRLRGHGNRARIVAAMLDLVAEGEVSPPAEAVAARAGVSARSVHNHFDDVEALRAEVARRQWERHAHFGEPVPKERLVDQRAALYERITPLRRAARILSRVRSPIISRSNCAKESRMFRVRRPRELVVLNCWVTETKLTPCWSSTSMIRAKSSSERVRRSTL